MHACYCPIDTQFVGSTIIALEQLEARKEVPDSVVRATVVNVFHCFTTQQFAADEAFECESTKPTNISCADEIDTQFYPFAVSKI